MAMYQSLCRKFLVQPDWRTLPHPEFACTAATGTLTDQPPKLMRAYLSIGAKICGPPALDREFGTIDFLTLLDLHSVPPMVRAHFFR
jgi:putative hemolysin